MILVLRPTHRHLICGSIFSVKVRSYELVGREAERINYVGSNPWKTWMNSESVRELFGHANTVFIIMKNTVECACEQNEKKIADCTGILLS